MTENQKMDLILQKLGGIEGGLASVGEDVRLLQGDVQSLKEDVQTPVSYTHLTLPTTPYV